MNEIITTLHRHRRFLFYLLLAFIAGCICTGFFFIRQRPAIAGRLDTRYDSEYTRATDIVARLEDELRRERDINLQLRDNNNRARELTEGLAASVERNVRNLSDAVNLIGEIRSKIKALEEFYSDWNSSDGSN